MIGRLTGILLEKQPPSLLLDVHGVAYEVDAPMSTFYKLPETGQQITLHTHLVVREDAQLLYGFAELKERGLFRHLLKVSGIGPRVALAILSGIEPDNFIRCVLNHDPSSLTRIPGVGKKTAERLVVEMQDRFKHWQTEQPKSAGVPLAGNQQLQEAISALVALGYKPEMASRLLAKVDTDNLTLEQMIRQALRATVE